MGRASHAVVDSYNDGGIVGQIGDFQKRAEFERFMCSRQTVFVIYCARSSAFTVKLRCVVAGNTGLRKLLNECEAKQAENDRKRDKYLHILCLKGG